MAIEYTWSFPNFETDNDNKVKVIHWKLDAVDGEYNAGMYGSCVGADMDFDSMSKEDCVACVVSEGDATEDDMKNMLSLQIESKKNPETVSKTKEW